MQEIQPAPYAEIAVPPTLGQRLHDVFGLESVPRRLGDLVGLFGRMGTEIDQADLWAPAPTLHAVQTAARSGYTNCAIDAIMLPAITGQPVELRSECPHCGELIEVRVVGGRVQSSHPAAVMSFGLMREGDGPVQAIGCPVINLFPSAGHYRAWAAATPQAETVMLPLAAGFAMASDLVRGGEREAEPTESSADRKSWMNSDAYDVVIVGGGPAGYVAAIRASPLGLKTGGVEREHLGGSVPTGAHPEQGPAAQCRGRLARPAGEGVRDLTLDGKTEAVAADTVLVAVGVQPNSEGLGLEAIGMATERSLITVDDRMRTNVPGLPA